MSGYTNPLRVREDEGEEKTPEELGYSVMRYTPHGRIEPKYTPPPPRPAKHGRGPRAGPRLPVSSTLGPALTPHLDASAVPPSEILPIPTPSHAATAEGPPKQRQASWSVRRSAMGRKGGHAKARKARLASMNAEVDAELGAEPSPTPGPEPRPATESAGYINPRRVREARRRGPPPGSMALPGGGMEDVPLVPPVAPPAPPGPEQTSFADLAPVAPRRVQRGGGPAAPLVVPDASEGGIQLRAPGPSQQAQQQQEAERFLFDNMGQGAESRQLGFEDVGQPCATEGCPYPATSSEPGALCKHCQPHQLPLEEPHPVAESASYINPLHGTVPHQRAVNHRG